MTFYIPSSAVSALCGRHRFRLSGDETLNVLKNQRNNQLLEDKLSGGKLYQRMTSIYKQECRYLQHLDDLNVQPEGLAKEHCLEHRIQVDIQINPEYQTQRDYVHKLYQTIANTSNVKDLVQTPNLNTEDAQEKIKHLEQNISQVVENPDTQKALLREVVMERGTNLESSAIMALRRDGVPLIVDTTHKSKKFTTVNGLSYTLGGRVDAYISVNPKSTTKVGVLEIKSRKNRVYGESEMPDYDIDQLACYYILTNLSVYAIAEYYNSQITLTHYEKGMLEQRWIELKRGLDNWVTEMDLVSKAINKYELLNEQSFTLSDSDREILIQVFDLLREQEKQ